MDSGNWANVLFWLMVISGGLRFLVLMLCDDWPHTVELSHGKTLVLMLINISLAVWIYLTI